MGSCLFLPGATTGETVPVLLSTHVHDGKTDSDLPSPGPQQHTAPQKDREDVDLLTGSTLDSV